MTDPLTLRLVAEDDLTWLERLTQDPSATGEFAWWGWYAPGRPQQRWAENHLVSEDSGTLAVVGNDELLGFVQWRRRQTTPVSHSWVIGVTLLPEARGRGHGTEAHRLLVRYLFAHSTAHRIEADTEVDNIAEQRALEKAGFSREGVMRGCAWRDGAWRDGVTYGLLRTDPQV